MSKILTVAMVATGAFGMGYVAANAKMKDKLSRVVDENIQRLREKLKSFDRNREEALPLG